MIDDMISYSKANAPLSKDLSAEEVGGGSRVPPLASRLRDHRNRALCR